jgi:NAD(P)H-quinone oxidoreductase subunit 5
MAVFVILTRLAWIPSSKLWCVFQTLSLATLGLPVLLLILGVNNVDFPFALKVTTLGIVFAVLVQILGTVIGAFSARYLEGEANQTQYISALAAVLANVHLLLLADHWLLLIVAWALVGTTMQPLLCFYSNRPFAMLAAHKKRIADRLADAMLLAAAVISWFEVGSGSLSTLWVHIAQQGVTIPLQVSAVFLVLAIILRSALLPVHGWLIQVMEAPTPVSALLHAGVINLGCFVLILFAPMLEQAPVARILLLVFGLATAVLAGMVMLTRISIKVRLAWSTVAQMGFMLLECALGLYTLAALHLIGHSLYKAHAFLSASAVVRQTRLNGLYRAPTLGTLSIVIAPILTVSVVFLVLSLTEHTFWPWWWSFILGLAWAPLLWLPVTTDDGFKRATQYFFGLMIVIGLTIASIILHKLPLGILDNPDHPLGWITLMGMLALYLCQSIVQRQPRLLSRWRRWSYAGFYLDEAYTRLALSIWPSDWIPESTSKLMVHHGVTNHFINGPR